MTRPTSKTLLLPSTASRIYLMLGTECNKLQYYKMFRRDSAVYSPSSLHQVSHLPILVRFFFSAVKQLQKLTHETYRIPNKRSLIRFLFHYVIRHVKMYKSISSAIYWVLPVVNVSNNFHSHCTTAGIVQQYGKNYPQMHSYLVNISLLKQTVNRLYEPPLVIFKISTLLTQCFYMLCIILTIKSNYFTKQLYFAGLFNRDGVSFVQDSNTVNTPAIKEQFCAPLATSVERFSCTVHKETQKFSIVSKRMSRDTNPDSVFKPIHTLPSLLLTIHFNIILPHMHQFSK